MLRRFPIVLAGALAALAAGVPAHAESPFAVAPLVVSSPAFGTGAGLAGLYFYRPQAADTVSPASIAAAIGLYSNTDSNVLGAFGRNYLDHDAWRLTYLLGRGHVNCDYDVPGLGSVQFATDSKLGLLRSEWRMRGRWFFGGLASATSFSYREGNEASRTFFALADVKDNTAGLFGPTAVYDTKDDQNFPLNGSYADFVYMVVPEWLGSTVGYWVLRGQGDWFRELRPRQVLALHTFGRFTPSGTPYSGLSTLGRTSDLRGYKSGKLTAENLLSTQAELRWMFLPRWGAVGFGGVATLYDGAMSNIDRDHVYWSGGAGLRFVLQQENHMNFRVDYAWGEQDEEGAYVSIGEAF